MSKVPTYDDLMKEKPLFIAEYDGYLYVKLFPKQFYENTIWKVNKKTKEVSYMMFTQYLGEIDDSASYIVSPPWANKSEGKAAGS